jgi:hypothetical protein
LIAAVTLRSRAQRGVSKGDGLSVAHPSRLATLAPQDDVSSSWPARLGHPSEQSGGRKPAVLILDYRTVLRIPKSAQQGVMLLGTFREMANGIQW